MELKKRIKILKEKINLQDLKEESLKINKESESPQFWQDHQQASAKMKQLTQIEEEIADLEELDKLLLAGEAKKLEKKLQLLELKAFFSGKYDCLPAIFSILFFLFK